MVSKAFYFIVFLVSTKPKPVTGGIKDSPFHRQPKRITIIGAHHRNPRAVPYIIMPVQIHFIAYHCQNIAQMVAEFILPKIEGLIAFLFFARILPYSGAAVNRLFFYFFISVHRHYIARGIKHIVRCVYGLSSIFCCVGNGMPCGGFGIERGYHTSCAHVHKVTLFSMPSMGIACIFTIIRLDNQNLQKMKPPTRLSSQKLIGMPVRILERLSRERTGKGQSLLLPTTIYNFGILVVQ